MKSALILISSLFILIIASALFSYGIQLREPAIEQIDISPPIVISNIIENPELEKKEASTTPTSTKSLSTSSQKTVSGTTTTSWFNQIQSLLPKTSVPTTTIVATITTTTPSTTPNVLPEQIVNPQSILGIVCTYDYSYNHPLSGQLIKGETMKRGSGVIVNAQGYLITNRHLLEWPDEEENVTIGEKSYSVTVHYGLSGCKAGRVPKGTALPTRNEIVTINPLTQVTVLAYRLQPIYIRNTVGMTSNESFFSDFALLYISGLTEDASVFGINSLPTSFEYAKLLSAQGLDLTQREVITYGFPGDVTVGKGSSFQTLYFTGSVGRVTKINQGEQYYRNTPLYIETKMEIYPGRSGSPVFWRGYVIGLVMAEDSNNRTNSYSVTSDVILRDIQSYLN